MKKQFLMAAFCVSVALFTACSGSNKQGTTDSSSVSGDTTGSGSSAGGTGAGGTGAESGTSAGGASSQSGAAAGDTSANKQDSSALSKTPQ